MISTTPRTLAQGASTLAIGCLGLFSPVFPAMAQTVPAKGSDDDARTSQAPANLGGVTVTDTAIELTGTCPTSKEKQATRRIAQSFASNRKVSDHIKVAGKGAGTSTNPPTSTGTTPPSSPYPQPPR